MGGAWLGVIKIACACGRDDCLSLRRRPHNSILCLADMAAAARKKVALVWSRAATEQCRYLSNFQHVEGRGMCVTMPDDSRQWFRSIELAFHAHKFYYLAVESRPDLAVALSSDGVRGGVTGAAQKSAGGKAAMRRLGVALDVQRWNAVAPAVLEKLVFSRAEHDPAYVNHCRDLVRSGYTIAHYSGRGGDKDHLGLGPALTRLGNVML